MQGGSLWPKGTARPDLAPRRAVPVLRGGSWATESRVSLTGAVTEFTEVAAPDGDMNESKDRAPA
jgi:hypothetical protein